MKASSPANAESRRPWEGAVGAPADARLTWRAFLTLLSALLQQGARTVVGLVVTPIVIRGLGKELYGAWMMIQQSVGYLALSDLRPMGTLKYTLALRQQAQDVSEKRRLIGAALALWAFTFPILLLLGVGLVWATPALIRTASGGVNAVRLAMGMVCIGVAMDRLLSLPANVLRGQNLEYKAMWVNAAAVVAGGALTAGAVWAGWGLPGVAGAGLVGVVLTGGTWGWVTRRVLPWFGAERPRKAELVQFTQVSAWNFFNALSWLLVSSDILLVGLLMGPSAAAIYSTTGIVMRLAVAFAVQMLTAGNAGLGDLCGQKAWERVEQVRVEMARFALAVTTVVGAGVLALNQAFLGLWVGEGLFGGVALNLLLVLAGIETLVFTVDSQVLDTLLEFKPKTTALLLCGVFVWTAGPLLSRAWGAAGVAFALLLAYGGLMVYQPLLIRRRTGIAIWPHARGLVRPGLVAGLVLAAAWMLPLQLVPRTWAGFVGSAVAVGGVAGALVWAVGLSARARAELLARGRFLLQQRRGNPGR